MASSTELPDFRSHGGDKKLTPLTPETLQSDAYAQKCLIFLERLTDHQLQGLKILDVGCGRGDLVALLRSKGIRAFGIDIEENFLARGKVLGELFPDEFDVLSMPDETGKTIFPDGFFDLVASFQVLEHVEDLDLLAREIARLARPDGLTAHVFPAEFRVQEPHYGMPFIHWLPKQKLRRSAIKLFLRAGFGSRFFPDLPIADRATIIYDYSVRRTFYRSFREIREVFRRNRLEPIKNVGTDALIAGRAAYIWPLRKIFGPLLTSFWTAVLVARRVPDGRQ